MEFGDDHYFREFAAPGAVVSIFHATPDNPAATIVGDLASLTQLPAKPEAFDCIICTQVLQFIYDVRQAIQNLYAMLRPGGVLLATAHGISQISRYDMDRWGEYWRFTSLSLRRLLEDNCPGALIQVQPYGNVLAAVASLHGLASQEIGAGALEIQDPNYEVLISARCQKPAGPSVP